MKNADRERAFLVKTCTLLTQLPQAFFGNLSEEELRESCIKALKNAYLEEMAKDKAVLVKVGQRSE